ncbi:MFS transporter [Nocardia miyunensis]|uniref:MFS transporter n=1 Tax=Nocardia miyunensis TaxID=282684 RepID=UPI00082A6E91|nr:MFS transporter [Nocardia miyunensis]
MSTTHQTSRSHQRRVALASLIGSSVEYYEFFIYGLSASLVFGKLFFPSVDPVAGTLLSLSTFGVAFLARPIGGWLLGHFGDRIGRRTVLVLTLVGMGGATTLVGLLPGYNTIGIAAPIMLVVLRVIQGLAVAGGTTGGFLLTYEHTESGGRRGLFTGAVSTGSLVGLLLANGAFFLVNLLPKDQFMLWGWRLPFIASIALVGVGLYIRNRLAESPDFTEAKDSGQVSSNPALEVIREHPLRFVGLVLVTVPQSIFFYLGSVFSLSYAPKVGVSSTTVSLLVMVICALLVFVMPLFGWIGDRTSRPRAVFAGGMVVMVIAPFVWFSLFGTRNPVLLFIGFALLLGGFAVNYSVQGMYYPQLFPPHLRYTAIGVSSAVGNVLGGAFAPLIAVWLMNSSGSWVPVAGYMTAVATLALVITLFLRPGASSPIRELDLGPEPEGALS